MQDDQRGQIAIIGWGSLISSPGSLLLSSRWHTDGPLLPVEFARVSSGGLGTRRQGGELAQLRTILHLVIESRVHLTPWQLELRAGVSWALRCGPRQGQRNHQAVYRA
jgi:hypothetical protein